ncbi:MAG: SpoIID/LytB domain-containing protein [Planctomycetes bacterium]|nr:SpoIID/LytB domain-containing protein [Planctomycetota bacterium]
MATRRRRKSDPDPLRARGAILAVGIMLWVVLLGLVLSREDRSIRSHLPKLPIRDARPTIRVRLASLGPPPWTLALKGPAEVLVDGKAVARVDKKLQLRVDVDEGGLFLTHDDERLASGSLEINPLSHDATIDVATPQGSRRYRGTMRISSTGSAPRPRLEVPLDEYLAQVLPREMPLSYPLEALRAQVIAARSFALREALRRRGHEWAVQDDERSQVFGGEDDRSRRATEIVASTVNLVLAYEGEVLPGFFSANCGGRTRSAQEAFGGPTSPPPLQGARCGHCGWSRDFRWTWRGTARSLLDKLGLAGKLKAGHVIQTKDSEFESNVVFDLSGGKKTVSAVKIRRALGHHRVKSTCIEGFSLEGSQVTITGRGFGHGVGLCQNGARGLADQGLDALAILEHYYPGAQIVELQR